MWNKSITVSEITEWYWFFVFEISSYSISKLPRSNWKLLHRLLLIIASNIAVGNRGSSIIMYQKWNKMIGVYLLNENINNHF